MNALQEPPTPRLEQVLELLQLEQLDRDLFLGDPSPWLRWQKLPCLFPIGAPRKPPVAPLKTPAPEPAALKSGAGTTPVAAALGR